MDCNYVTFWVPTPVIHEDFTPLQFCQKKNISDNNKAHEVTLEIDEQSLNVQITSDHYGDVELRYISKTNYGLIQYQICSETGSKLLSKIPNAIYHIVKEFFHSHKHHHSEEDSLLEAYCSTTEVNLLNSSNPALRYYLDLYEEKFKRYSRMILDGFVENNENSENPSYKYKEISALTRLSQDSIQALGEKVYCNTLLISKPEDFDDFNIINAVADIEILKSKIETKINYKNNRNSIALTIIGTILTIVGIFLAVMSFRPSKEEKTLLLNSNNITTLIQEDIKIDRVLSESITPRITELKNENKKLQMLIDSAFRIEQQNFNSIENQIKSFTATEEKKNKIIFDAFSALEEEKQ